MTTTELDDVVALLGRVLTDPGGFAERLFQQVMTLWIGDPTTTHTEDAGASDLPRTVEGEVVDEPVSDSTSDDFDAVLPDDATVLLAYALGACEWCWGTAADCQDCGGEGTSGWVEPDVELFRELAGPALARLSAVLDATEKGPGDDIDDRWGDGPEPVLYEREAG